MQSDEEALALFIKDGGRREDWLLVDEAVRLYYRLKAQKGTVIRTHRPFDATKPTGRLSTRNTIIIISWQISSMGFTRKTLRIQ